MRLLRLKYCFFLFQMTVLVACSPAQVTPTQTQAAPAPSLAPIDLAGPEMKVGSSFLYADGSLLVAVPAGMFTMGRKGGLDNPEHEVDLPDFWIYRTKVTNAQYAYCVSQGRCTPPSQQDSPGFNDPLKSQNPVVGVTYDQAAAYCGFVHARLPTEAEWEKTARGPDANLYPWGDAAPTCDRLNFEKCVGSTTPVNQYPQGMSYYQAFDMEGNTFEWAADRYQNDYYLHSPADNPLGPDQGNQRVVRSSAFNSGGDQTQTFNRFFSNPVDQRSNLGFRCVVDDPAYFAPFCNYPPTYGTNGLGGASAGGQVKVDCPDLEIKQQSFCAGIQPYTIVTFSGLATSYGFPPTSCGAYQQSGQFICQGDGTLSICSFCKVTTTSQPLCPAGYTLDPIDKTCVRQQGGSGQCLPGFTLGTQGTQHGPILTSNTPVPTAASGSLGQCCTYDPGSVNLSNGTGSGVILGNPIFPSCPAGTFFDGHECISVAIQVPYCKYSGVDLKSCKSGGGGNPSCQPPYSWDPRYNCCAFLGDCQ